VFLAAGPLGLCSDGVFSLLALSWAGCVRTALHAASPPLPTSPHLFPPLPSCWCSTWWQIFIQRVIPPHCIAAIQYPSKSKDKHHSPSVAPHVTRTPPVTCQFHRRSSWRRFVRIRPAPHHQIGHSCRRHVPTAVCRRPGAEVCRSCRRRRRSEGSDGLGRPAHNPQPPTICRRQQQTRYHGGLSRFLQARRG